MQRNLGSVMQRNLSAVITSWFFHAAAGVILSMLTGRQRLAENIFFLTHLADAIQGCLPQLK